MHQQLDVIEVELPLTRPFATSRGEITSRSTILVGLTSHGATGWGEAAPYPGVTLETVDDVWTSLTNPPSGGWNHHPLPETARAALDEAAADLASRRDQAPLWQRLGGAPSPLPASAVVGLIHDRDGLLARVAAVVATGYARMKLKIEPGWDVEPLRLLRATFPELRIGLDGNGSYVRADAAHLREIDQYAPDYIEQPLPADDFEGHGMLRDVLVTPIALDEGVSTVATAMAALRAAATDIICIKPSRVGITGALEIHRACLVAGIDLKVSGMLESSVGKAFALAVGTLPGFSHFDLAAAADYFEVDTVLDPWRIVDGHIAPRRSPGIGCEPDLGALQGLIRRSAQLDY